MSAPLLSVEGLSKAFGRVAALSNVDLAVEPAGIHAVIGPNGAGKTTLFNLVTGLARADAGAIRLDGREVSRFPAYRRTTLGLCRTFQNIRLFGSLTVLENVMLGLHTKSRGGLLASLTALPFRQTAAETAARRRASEVLASVGLASRAGLRAVELPYGEQRRVEIARALASEPRLLLLDEPSAGMNAHETRDLEGLIQAVNETGVAILIIEHKMSLVMRLARRITVLNFGQRIAEGTPAEIQQDARVIEAYLGVE